MAVEDELPQPREGAVTFEEFQASLKAFLSPPKAPVDVTPAEHILSSDYTPASKEDYDKYEAAEHEATAKGLVLYDIYGSPFKASKALEIVHPNAENAVALNFSRIIALAGDFYTNRELNSSLFKDADYNPICGAFSRSTVTPMNRFHNAVNSLRQDLDGYLKGIWDLIGHEVKLITAVEKRGESVSHHYHVGKVEHHIHPDNCKLPEDSTYFKLLAGFKKPMLSFYAWLAYTNADHFGEDAIMAYSIGHACAIEKARKASRESEPQERAKLLHLAYIYEAFAAHYLTDLFSAGHLRAPRRLLHTTNSTMMAMSILNKVRIDPSFSKIMQGKWEGLVSFDGEEIPIWDLQQRYMHDDDCATGLLVKNKQGDQWIVYGDKQYFESKNAVNRARATQCLQASVDEVYWRGFRGQGSAEFIDNETAWKTYKDTFAAIHLLPTPMLAVKSNEWVPPEMNNPAPLWLAGEADGNGGSNDWTYRKDLNDHSNYLRESGAPGEEAGTFAEVLGKFTTPTARPECIRIRDAPFRHEDQYANQIVMEGLMSGGFLQVQTFIGKEPAGSTYVNFWGPALVEISDKVHETFTIRNRVPRIPTPAEDNVAGARSVHWCARNNYGRGSASTFLTGFYWKYSADSKTSSILVSETEFGERAPLRHTDPVIPGGQRKAFSLTRSWNVEPIVTLKPLTLAIGLPVADGSANLTRFLVDGFLPFDYSSPDFLAVTYLPENVAQISVRNPSMEEPFHSSVHLTLPLCNHTKAFRLPNSPKKLVLLVNAVYNRSQSVVDMFECTFATKDPSTELTLNHRHWSFNWEISADSEGDCSVLVGDVIGRNDEQVIVLAGDWASPEIHLYGKTSGGSEMISLGRNRRNNEPSMKIVRPYLAALVDSITGKGLDILRISQQGDNKGRKYLVFQTYVRSANDGGDEKSPIWDDIRESSVYDALASNPNGQYFHIKWLRTQYELKRPGKADTTLPALLEVFSWYGVLGVRMFSAGMKKWDYEEGGQQPYLGQTSIMVGPGCTGDWGSGILPWAPDTFTDSNIFLPSSKENLCRGCWGMAKDDVNRPCVDGWEVEKRPLR